MSAIHDATTGFHDIKPLPGFIIDNNLGTYLLLSFFLASIAAFYYFIQKRETTLPEQNLSPREIASLQLEELRLRVERQELTVRDFGEQLSFLLREFLEGELGFPAAEQTNSEVASSLARSLHSALPEITTDARDEMHSSALSCLWDCERLEFAKESEGIAQLTIPSIASLYEDAQRIIEDFSTRLRRERERRESIIEQSSAKDSAREEISSAI